MSDPPKPAPARRVYASRMMHDRRSRILIEARAILAESGAEGFSIRALSRRAAVSSRTLYTAFGGKDGILSAAVGEHILTFGRRLAERSSGGALPDLMREFDEVAAEVARKPAYIKTLLELFYSLTPLEPALEMIRELPARRLIRWLDDAAEPMIIAPLDRLWIVERHVDNELAVFHHWAVGRIPIEELGDALRRNFVATLAIVAREPLRSELLDDLGRP